MESPSSQDITLLVDQRLGAAADHAARAAGAILDEQGRGWSVLLGDVRATATKALGTGAGFVVAVGDDISFHELANAVAQAGSVDGSLVVGMVPADDCDLIRTFGLPQEPARAARHLLGNEIYLLDLARVTCAPKGGGAESSHIFAIVAEAGIGGARHAQSPGGGTARASRLRRFLTFWGALARTRNQEITVTVDRKTWQGSAYNVLVGNANFFDGGMRVSPRSYPGDGVLDILVFHGPKSDEFTTLPRKERGEQVPSLHIDELRAKIGVKIESTRPLLVHADGVPVGVTPAKFVVLPGAVRFKI